jgi:hypothetical protein
VAGAAGVAVAFAIALAVVLRPPADEQPESSAGLGSRVGLAARAALVALGSDEREFEAAREELLAVLDARRDRLPVGADQTVADNLEVIQAEIVAISEELERDPGNPRLARLLAEAYQRELELLQLAAALPIMDAPTDES